MHVSCSLPLTVVRFLKEPQFISWHHLSAWLLLNWTGLQLLVVSSSSWPEQTFDWFPLSCSLLWSVLINHFLYHCDVQEKQVLYQCVCIIMWVLLWHVTEAGKLHVERCSATHCHRLATLTMPLQLIFIFCDWRNSFTAIWFGSGIFLSPPHPRLSHSNLASFSP